MSRKIAESQAVGQSQRDAAELRVELSFDDLRTFLKSSSANISSDGVFVETEEPAPPGAMVALELTLSDGHPLVRGRGAVEWTRASGGGNEAPGMGIRFLDLAAESKRFIGRIVEERTKAGLAVFDLTREPSASPGTTLREGGAAERAPQTIPAAATDDLQAEMEELRRKHAEDQSRWEAELAAARETAADLNTRLRDSLSRTMAAGDARNALAEELRSVQEALQQDRQRVEGLDAERSRLRHELEEQQAENSRWTEEAVAATTERQALEERLAAAHDKIEELASEIGELRGSSAEEIAQAKTEIAAAHDNIEELASEIGELRGSSAEEIANAKAEIAKVTSAKEEIEGKLQETEAALEELEKEAAETESSLRQSLDESQSEIEEEHRKNEELVGEAKALEQKVDRFRTELAEAQERAEKLEIETEQIRDAMTRLQSQHEEMEAVAAAERKAATRAGQLVERVLAGHAALQDDLVGAQAALEEIEVSGRSLETEPANDRAEISATAYMDEGSEDEELAPQSTVKARLADFAAKLRGGKAAESYSDLLSLDEPVAESEPPEEVPEEVPEKEPPSESSHLG
jgi:uncharacterized protein (TIGR02266 family)